jgi:tripartite-type tricarboxylate transporter receptor subunit TctC
MSLNLQKRGSRLSYLLAPLLIMAMVSGCGALGSSAGDFPNKPITVLVSSSPGSAVDVMARTIAKAAEKELGQPIVIETKTGGSGATAMAALVSGKADGYTLYAMTRSQSVLFASGKIKDFTHTDIQPVVRIQDDPYLWAVRADSPYNSLKDLIDDAKKNPGKVKFSGFGAGSAHHLTAIQLSDLMGIKTTWVPYDGGSQAVAALLGGHINAVNTNPGTVLAHVNAGKIRVLATASQKKIDTMKAPTFTEQGVNFVGSHWRGLITKKGAPDAVLNKLAAAFKKAADSPEFVALMQKTSVMNGYLAPKDFTKYLNEEVQANKDLIKQAGLK